MPRSLRAVRQAERRAGGHRHLLLFEPSALWSETGSGAPPDFPHDRDVVYAPHIYTGGFTGGPITAAAFEVARTEARGFGGAPVLSGEWGADPGRAAPGGDSYFLDHQRLQDDFEFGATLWTWRESCGDPHKVTDYREGRVPTVWGEFEVDCRTNSVVGVRHDLVDQLTRAYTRAAPGHLQHSVVRPGDQAIRGGRNRRSSGRRAGGVLPRDTVAAGRQVDRPSGLAPPACGGRSDRWSPRVPPEARGP